MSMLMTTSITRDGKAPMKQSNVYLVCPVLNDCDWARLRTIFFLSILHKCSPMQRMSRSEMDNLPTKLHFSLSLYTLM